METVYDWLEDAMANQYQKGGWSKVAEFARRFKLIQGIDNLAAQAQAEQQAEAMEGPAN